MRDAYYPLLADPSPESWRGICKLLDSAPSDAARHAEALALKRELSVWPPEVERPAPRATAKQRRDALLALCRDVREVDLYDYYITAARDAPALRLRDGTPAVRLQRQFTGALQGAHGRTHRIGKRGNADLNGSLCVEWGVETFDPACGECQTAGRHGHMEWRRLPVPVEVEVKRQSGKQDPEQVERMEALHRRNEVYLLVRRTEEMVRLLVAERDRYLRLVARP